MEALTDEIEERANGYLERIRRLGGTLRALESGFIQREIAEEAYRYQRDVEDGSRIVVGVNAFTEEEPADIQMSRIDPRLEARQVKRLNELRDHRDGRKVEHSLARLKEAAEREENLLPYVIEAARHHCSLGEISDSLRDIYGEFSPIKEF